MKTVANLNQDYTNIIAHSEQQLLEILSLSRSLITENTTTDFSQTVYNLCYFSSEYVFNVINSIVCVFNDIVKQRSTYTC